MYENGVLKEKVEDVQKRARFNRNHIVIGCAEY